MRTNRLKWRPAALATVAMALALAACNDEGPANDPLAGGPVALSVTADINGVATRVNGEGTGFSDNDRIGIFPVKNDQVETAQANRLYTYSGTEFGSESPYWFQDPEPVTFHAYYPYDESLTADNHTIVVDTRAENQENMEGMDWRKNDYLAASARTSVANPEVSFTGENAFSHVMSQIQFVFVAGIDNGVSNLDYLTKYRLTTSLTMDGTFDPAAGTVTLGAGTTKGTIGMRVVGTPGQTTVNATPLILLPQAIDGGKLNIEVTYNNQTYKAELEAPEGGLEAGCSYTYTVTIKNTGLEAGKASINTWKTDASYNGTGSATM